MLPRGSRAPTSFFSGRKKFLDSNGPPFPPLLEGSFHGFPLLFPNEGLAHFGPDTGGVLSLFRGGETAPLRPDGLFFLPPPLAFFPHEEEGLFFFLRRTMLAVSFSWVELFFQSPPLFQGRPRSRKRFSFPYSLPRDHSGSRRRTLLSSKMPSLTTFPRLRGPPLEGVFSRFGASFSAAENGPPRRAPSFPTLPAAGHSLGGPLPHRIGLSRRRRRFSFPTSFPKVFFLWFSL